MRTAEVWLVVGTRPEAIKLSPVADALAARGLGCLIVTTGQHADLHLPDFGLGHLPKIALNCPGLAQPDAHVARVRRAMLRHLATPPALVVVQGDTSSALGAAQAAFDRGTPVAHVEAGLRTGDPTSPWPEESYRTAIDARADLLFAPTKGAATNLAREDVPGAVFVTGNSGIDATLSALEALPASSLRETTRPQILVTCHRRESWGSGLDGVAAAVRSIAASRLADVRFVLHPNAHVAATMRSALADLEGVELVAPCGHSAMLAMMREADLVLSDSGGMQEEAPVLGVPILVLRDKTERPEGLATGNAILVGTDPERIVEQVGRLLADPVALGAMGHRALPYGDGRSAPQIAALVAQWLSSQRLSA